MGAHAAPIGGNHADEGETQMKRRDLIEIIERFTAAADAIEQNWAQGDLANAVNWLIDVRDTFAKPALELWKSEE